jgi:hypothetical protein
MVCASGSKLIDLNTLGPEITLRCCTVKVALHHPNPGLLKPLSFGKIGKIVGVAKSTCRDIYRYAVKNATSQRVQQLAVRGTVREVVDLGTMFSEQSGEGNLEDDRDKCREESSNNFLRSIYLVLHSI